VLNDSAGGMGVVAGLRVTAAPLRRSTMETVEALVSTRIWTGVHSHLDGVYAGVGAREDVAHDASRRGEMRFLERAEARGLGGEAAVEGVGFPLDTGCAGAFQELRRSRRRRCRPSARARPAASAAVAAASISALR
jgi:hypothetical protein